ncbi:MAG: menaquinone biosynthesis decarboxylase [Bacteroidota bacterium]
MYKNLTDFIRILDEQGELIRVKEFVSPVLEITEITDRVSKAGGKALLFENTGTDFPLLINAMGSIKRICLALGVNSLDDIGKDIESLFKKIVSPKDGMLDKLKVLPALNEVASWMPKSVSKKAPCQQVVMKTPDINLLPILQCWPYDGGKFITLPLVNTVSPVTNIRNVGMYRMQVFGPDLTAMHWHLHKNSARHYREYKKLGIKMPVAVALGGDPVYTYAATAPLPDNIDEYMLAGFLRKKKVELVKCLTQDIEVPADADFVIEGYVDPAEELIWEGPFGDHTGYYSLPDWYPKFHITCITHKKDAVYPATIVGIPPMEDAYMGKATERIFLTPIRIAMLPEIIDMAMPPEGVFHNLAIIKIRNEYPGHATKVMNSLWGAGQMMFNKMMIVVDEETNIHDTWTLIKSVFKNISISEDIFFNRGPIDVLDHASTSFAYGGKIGIDATNKRNIQIGKNSTIDISSLQKKYPFLKDINFDLWENEIPVVIAAIDKSSNDDLNKSAEDFVSDKAFTEVRVICLCDAGLDIHCYADVIWSVLNNIDAVRDCRIYKSNVYESSAKLIIDGTHKIPDNTHKRQWPNVTVMDDVTIKSVDEKWKTLGLGDFIPSPSYKYKTLLKGNGAIAD